MMFKRIVFCAALIAPGISPALADDCDKVVAAIVKTDHTPNSDISVDDTMKITIKSIFTGDVYYLKTGDGDWSSKPQTGDAAEAEFRHAHEGAQWSCHVSGTETIGGDLADIVSVQDQDGSSLPENRYWISQVSGLLLKTELHAGFGRHLFQVTDTYDYNNFQAPPN